ncbi:MAG: hypothetical protein AAF690_19390 [Acidobacteriota bacterium]
MAAEICESNPALSVVLVGAGDTESVQKTFEHLDAQTVRDRVEVVLAVPSAEALHLDALPIEKLFGVRVVETGDVRTTARARAVAVQASRAPVVALAEDHSFPPADWAERLLEAHRDSYVAIAPQIANANPKSVLSWANFLIEYGPWMWADGPTEPEHLPGHNGSYKREALLGYGDRLGAMLEAESLIHWDLRERGERLLLLPGARTLHLNFSRPLASLKLRFHGGRAFAAARSESWSLPRRLFYALAAPAIPPLRLARTVRTLRQTPDRGVLLRVLPALAGLLALDGLGEAAGYVLGAGASDHWLSRIELRRERYLRDADKPLAFPAA